MEFSTTASQEITSPSSDLGVAKNQQENHATDVESLLRTMRENMATAAVQKEELKKLSDTPIPEATRTDVIRVVITSMRTHAADLSVLTEAAGALAACGEAETTRANQAMWEEGAASLILSAMDRILHDVGQTEPGSRGEEDPEGGHGCKAKNAIQKCCITIRNMYRHTSQPHDEAGLSTVTRVMSKHIDCASLQQAAMQVLQTASQNSSKNSEYLGTHAVDAVLDGMVAHVSSKSVVAVGNMTLLELCLENTLNACHLFLEENLQKLLQFMENHMDTFEFQKSGMMLIRGLLTAHKVPPHLKKNVINSGVLAHFVRAMKTHPSVVEVQSLGCQTIGYLADKCSFHVEFLECISQTDALQA
jgi:hypothetical protein